MASASGESTAVASGTGYGGIIFVVAGFALAVFVVVSLLRRYRRRSKPQGLSHML
ncbi:MAG: hypothetical protein ACQKBW_01980 [Puniceicoccales bacterium]